MVNEYDLLGYYPLKFTPDELFVVNFRVYKVEVEFDTGTMIYNLNLN